MKIIVGIGDGETQEYHAGGWTVNENGALKIFRSYSDAVGVHASGAWNYVREVEE